MPRKSFTLGVIVTLLGLFIAVPAAVLTAASAAFADGARCCRVSIDNLPGQFYSGGNPQPFTLRPLPPDPNAPVLDEKELRFSWAALPGQTFLFQLSPDPQFSRIEIERALVEPRIALERPAAGTYYMRVRATDPDGYVGPFTTAQRVEVPENTTRPWWVLLLFLLLVPFM